MFAWLSGRGGEGGGATDDCLIRGWYDMRDGDRRQLNDFTERVGGHVVSGLCGIDGCWLVYLIR